MPKNNRKRNKAKQHNDKSIDNNRTMNTITGSSQIASTSTANSFDVLGGDVEAHEQPLPAIPDIPGMDKMNERQKQLYLLQIAEKLDLTPVNTGIAEILAENPAAAASPTAAKGAGAVPKSAAAKAAAKSAAAKSAAAKSAAAKSAVGKSAAAYGLSDSTGATARESAANSTPTPMQLKNGMPNGLGGGRDRSESRKRKANEEMEANKRPRQQGSNNGSKTETVFLSGVKDEIKKNGIIFKREFSRVVKGIKIIQVFFTRSGSVGLIPATPRDVNALLAEDWSKHTELGDSVEASPARAKIIKHIAIIKGVDPNLDDNTLKEELESMNNLSLTSIERCIHRESGTKTWKVKLGLENEETLKRVLKGGLLLGFTKHKCIPVFDRRNSEQAEQPISQCFKCQKWDPKHTNSNCQGVRACLWCAADHFHKECPLFQARNKENAKCVNCKGAHPAWSKSCPSYTEASQCSTKVTAARVVSSSSISKADLDTAMGELWKSLAGVIATVAARSVLDLRAEEERAAEAGSKVSGTMLAKKVAATTTKTMNECRPLQVSRPLEVTEMQKLVWKALFPQVDFPAAGKASSTPHKEKTIASLSLK